MKLAREMLDETDHPQFFTIELPDHDLKLVQTIRNKEEEIDEEHTIRWDSWRVFESDSDVQDSFLWQKDHELGEFEIVTHSDGEKLRVPEITFSRVNIRGKGIGRVCMKELVKFYGVLRSSSDGVTSDLAQKAWKSIGGKRLPDPQRRHYRMSKHVNRSKFIIGKHQIKERGFIREILKEIGESTCAIRS